MADIADKRAPRRQRLRPERAPTTPDPIEIAMDFEAHDSSNDSPARRLLESQNLLVRWQIASERAKFALRLLTAAAGIAAAVILGFMVWNASRADGLVVEPFLVPAALEQQGMSGAAVARQVLDRMSSLDRETGYSRPVHVTDGWSQKVEIPIPQAGVSLGDIDRMLRRWLGRQTHVSGEVSALGDEISILIRTSDGLIARVAGPVSDISVLTDQAAESLFAQARPVQYGYGLARRGDWAGARAYADIALRSGLPSEAGFAHSIRALTLHQEGRLNEALAEYGLAVALQPEEDRSYLGMGFVQSSLGLEEAALENFGRSARQPLKKQLNPTTQRQLRAISELRVQYESADYVRALATGKPIFDIQVRGFLSPDSRPEQVRTLLGLHEISAAAAVAPRVFEASLDANRRVRFVRQSEIWIAVARGDWSTVLALLEADPGSAPAGAEVSGKSLTAMALRARALAHLGRLREADSLATSLPGYCAFCLRAQAEVAELMGDRTRADRAYAEAVRQTPSLPFANLEWGLARMARGQTAMAISNFKAASKVAPGFADPLEAWGEALLATGDARSAAERFAAAAPLAPRWGRLHMKWGEALAELGKTDEARAKWRAAAMMDLTNAERAELATLSRRRTS